MVRSGDQIHGGDERLPRVALLREHAPAFNGQGIEATSPLAWLFHPPAVQPAAFFEAIEQRIERGDIELHPAFGPALDQLADLVTVARPRLDDRQDDQLGRDRKSTRLNSSHL